MCKHYVHKFFARCGADREQEIRPVEFPENMFVELSEIQKDFGDRWEVWIESFHRVHPHTALQRRLEGYVNEKRGPARLRLDKGEGTVKGWEVSPFK